MSVGGLSRRMNVASKSAVGLLALMAAMGTTFTIATPAFPDNHRTVFKGHLFVGDALLNESGMQNHNPSTRRSGCDCWTNYATRLLRRTGSAPSR